MKEEIIDQSTIGIVKNTRTRLERFVVTLEIEGIEGKERKECKMQLRGDYIAFETTIAKALQSGYILVDGTDDLKEAWAYTENLLAESAGQDPDSQKEN